MEYTEDDLLVDLDGPQEGLDYAPINTAEVFSLHGPAGLVDQINKETDYASYTE